MATVTFISRMTCKPEHREAFVTLCRDLERYVEANEPDTRLFKFYKLREPNRYAVLESFPSEAAEEHHMNSSQLQQVGPKIAACLEGGWQREYLDDLE